MDSISIVIIIRVKTNKKHQENQPGFHAFILPYQDTINSEMCRKCAAWPPNAPQMARQSSFSSQGVFSPFEWNESKLFRMEGGYPKCLGKLLISKPESREFQEGIPLQNHRFV